MLEHHLDSLSISFCLCIKFPSLWGNNLSVKVSWKMLEKSKYKLTRKWKVWSIRKMNRVLDKISLHYFYNLHLIAFGPRISYCPGVLQRKSHTCHLCLITEREKFHYWSDSSARDTFHTKVQCAPIFLTRL